MKKNEQRMNTQEAAEYLRLHPNTLCNWRSTGKVKLPYLKVGNKVFYRKYDLDKWLDEQSRTHTA